MRTPDLLNAMPLARGPEPSSSVRAFRSDRPRVQNRPNAASRVQPSSERRSAARAIARVERLQPVDEVHGHLRRQVVAEVGPGHEDGIRQQLRDLACGIERAPGGRARHGRSRSALRACVRHLQRHLGRRRAGQGVHIKAVGPRADRHSDSRAVAHVPECPTAMVGKATEVAAAGVFLASDDASCITGATFGRRRWFSNHHAEEPEELVPGAEAGSMLVTERYLKLLA